MDLFLHHSKVGHQVDGGWQGSEVEKKRYNVYIYVDRITLLDLVSLKPIGIGIKFGKAEFHVLLRVQVDSKMEVNWVIFSN